MNTFNNTVLILMVMAPLCQCMVGCNDGRGKEDVLAQLGNENEFIRQVSANFPDVPQFITHQTGEYGSQDWHVTIGVLDRYLLEIQMPIVWDDRDGILINHEKPKFYFRRIESITPTPGGGSRVKYDLEFECLEDFDMKDWETLRKNDFDFTKAFSCLKGDDPVENFQDYIDNRHGE